MTNRIFTFVLVGALGFAVQIAVLVFLTVSLGWPYAWATAVAVAAAAAHNFCWHERWTWADRAAASRAMFGRVARYCITTGATSVGGNVVITSLCIEVLGLPLLAANAVAVVAMTMANFMAGDRWVFAAAVTTALVVAGATPSAAAGVSNETLTAWNGYVAAAADNLHRCEGPCSEDQPEGTLTPVAGGTIHRWRGSTVVAGMTVDALVEALKAAPPRQEDVLEARVLARGSDSMRVYLKLRRSAIVTVEYDTVHEVTFQRGSRGVATSRSIATRIAETAGGDRGFLWRLNTYWRYTPVPGGVRVEVDSISLSRDLPWGLRTMAGPIVSRIGRESVSRALAAVRQHVESERVAESIRRRAGKSM
jgi:putative flippase GtrA